MKNLITRLVREDKGQDVIEYALIAAAISVVAIPFVPTIGSTVGIWWSRIDGKVQSGAGIGS